MAKNTDLWDSVCETDPKFTKKVDMRGGYTAIDPHYQLLNATKIWGPYGSTWGVRYCRWGMIPPVTEKDKPTMTLDAEFWYPEGKFDVSSDMIYRANDDCRKKLLTSVRSKALATLGFNADIFMGKFEDNKYVADVKTKFADQDELLAKAMSAIKRAESESSLNKCRTRADHLYDSGAINKTMWNELMQAIDGMAQENGWVLGPPAE